MIEQMQLRFIDLQAKKPTSSNNFVTSYMPPNSELFHGTKKSDLEWPNSHKYDLTQRQN